MCVNIMNVISALIGGKKRVPNYYLNDRHLKPVFVIRKEFWYLFGYHYFKSII